jgi:hypothetical protein
MFKKNNEVMYHILYNDYAYDERVKKQINALRENHHLVNIVANYNGDYSVKSSGLFLFLIKTILLLVKIKASALHCHDWYGGIVGIVFKSLFNQSCVIIYDAHELYFNRKKNIRLLIILCIEYFVVKLSNQIICVNKQRARIFKCIYQLDDTPVIIGNRYEYDDKIIKEKELKYLAVTSRLESDNITRLLYVGSTGKNRELHKWIKAISKQKNMSLTIIGDEKNLKNVNYNNIFILGKKNHEYIKKNAVNYDIGIVSYSKLSLNDIYCEPNKIGEYASWCMPFISSDNYNVSVTVSIYRNGIVLDNVNARVLREGVKNILSDYYFYLSMQLNYLEKNSWGKEKMKLINLYNHLFVN